MIDLILFGVFGNRQTNERQMDICTSRVAFATENIDYYFFSPYQSIKKMVWVLQKEI